MNAVPWAPEFLSRAAVVDCGWHCGGWRDNWHWLLWVLQIHHDCGLKLGVAPGGWELFGSGSNCGGSGFEFEFEFHNFCHGNGGRRSSSSSSSKRNDIVFPEGGEGGVRVQVRVREVAPREGAGGGSSSSNSARKQHKILISTWERGIRVQFEFRFGRSCRGGGSSSLNSLRNMCFLEGYVGIVGSMLCDYSIVDSYKHLIDIHSII